MKRAVSFLLALVMLVGMVPGMALPAAAAESTGALNAYYTSGTDPVMQLDRKYSCRFIPIHEWEFSHRPAGVTAKATQDFTELYQAFGTPYAAGRAQFLFWGESIELD